MSGEQRDSPASGTARTLREHCERILKELERLYAENPRKSLLRSIDEVNALLARLPTCSAPPQ